MIIWMERSIQRANGSRMAFTLGKQVQQIESFGGYTQFFQECSSGISVRIQNKNRMEWYQKSEAIYSLYFKLISTNKTTFPRAPRMAMHLISSFKEWVRCLGFWALCLCCLCRPLLSDNTEAADFSGAGIYLYSVFPLKLSRPLNETQFNYLERDIFNPQ
jgi:hypothetical protein